MKGGRIFKSGRLIEHLRYTKIRQSVWHGNHKLGISQQWVRLFVHAITLQLVLRINRYTVKPPNKTHIMSLYFSKGVLVGCYLGEKGFYYRGTYMYNKIRPHFHFFGILYFGHLE